MTLQEATEKLFQAARTGDLAAAIAALDAGADVNAKTSYLDTPLHRAAYYGHADTARFLIENGANVNLEDDLGQTPLHWAAAHGHTDTARLLTVNGADVNAEDKSQRTPLHLASELGHAATMVMLEAAIAKPYLATLEEKDRKGNAVHVEHERANAEQEAQGIFKTGKRQWVATLPPEDDNDIAR